MKEMVKHSDVQAIYRIKPGGWGGGGEQKRPNETS